ncbi:MAG: hypothetical protein OHK0017_08980 [Patescibacteria group bacterium]
MLMYQLKEYASTSASVTPELNNSKGKIEFGVTNLYIPEMSAIQRMIQDKLPSDVHSYLGIRHLPSTLYGNSLDLNREHRQNFKRLFAQNIEKLKNPLELSMDQIHHLFGAAPDLILLYLHYNYRIALKDQNPDQLWKSLTLKARNYNDRFWINFYFAIIDNSKNLEITREELVQITSLINLTTANQGVYKLLHRGQFAETLKEKAELISVDFEAIESKLNLILNQVRDNLNTPVLAATY